MTSDILANNLEAIHERIATAARNSGRDPGNVRLVVVTKAAAESVFPALARLGVTDVGENRVQALAARRAECGGPFRWHLIGQLQRNKVAPAIASADLIHSVDSLQLAERIDAVAAREGRKVDALVQVNVSGEVAKSGLRPEDVPGLLDRAALLPHLHIRGFMTMAPLDQEPERARPVFRALADLSRRERLRLGDRVGPELSMGMTQDFEVAIAEGATLVRVGTAVFAGVES